MLRTLLLAATLLFAAAAPLRAQEAVPFGDPFILCHEGRYYAYGTRAADGIAVVVSDDMRTWRYPDDNPRHLALDKRDSYADRRFWAPEVYLLDGRFYMYYSADEHICVATADSPLGPFRQQDKRPMVEEKGIDCSLFIDRDGTPYLYWVRFTNGNEIWCAELERDYVTLKPATRRYCFGPTQPWEQKMARVCEGPFVVRHGDLYYMTYSANHYESPDYGVGYAVSTSPLGPWRKYEGNPVLRRPRGLVGTGHHSLFTDAEGRTRIVFHAHRDTTTIHPRTMHISTYRFRPHEGSADRMEVDPHYFTPTLVR